MSNSRFPAGLGHLSLCALVAATLTACGGGEGAGAAGSLMMASATGASPTDTGDSAAGESSTSSAAPDTNALAVKASSQVGVRVAKENQNFLVTGTMTVRYGAGSAWITKQVTDAGSCTNDYFRKDPAFGIVKSCEVLVADAVTDTKKSVSTAGVPTVEGGTFYVFGTTSVRYGANNKWVTKDVTGRAECTNAFFGNDPFYGTVKACQLPSPVTTPTATAAAAVAAPAVVVSTPTPTAPITVMTAALAPTTSATPASTSTLTSTLTTAATTAATISSLLPTVDKTKIPPAEAGFATDRVAAANVDAPGQVPVPSDIGDFREYCEFSHMSYDDPIVAPGSIGGHLHTFLGNTGTNAKSTAQSIAGTGNSTCAGGTLNRSSYWVPTVIDTKDGTPLKPQGSLIYYKQGYNYIPSASIKPFPAGLRMVAGNPASTGVQDGVAGFTCFKPDGTWINNTAIPTECPAGSTLTIGVSFPQCWDGVNLDSPDHRSHMAYAVIGCPSTHPVPLTHITFNINYSVTEANATARWRLSSDDYDKNRPGGYSSHADWFNGWNTGILNAWTTRCINASMDCHAFLIGDGRILY